MTKAAKRSVGARQEAAKHRAEAEALEREANRLEVEEQFPDEPMCDLIVIYKIFNDRGFGLTLRKFRDGFNLSLKLDSSMVMTFNNSGALTGWRTDHSGC